MKTASSKKPNIIIRYFRETAGELRKVNWPTRQQATELTIIVLVVIAATSILLGATDFLFSRFFAFLLNLGA
jgi:preprotein translocase subunit SecE